MIPKIVFSLLLVLAYGFMFRVVYPAMSTQVALDQLKDEPAAYTNYVVWQQAWQLGWLAIFAVVLLVFRKELMAGYRAFKTGI